MSSEQDFLSVLRLHGLTLLLPAGLIIGLCYAVAAPVAPPADGSAPPAGLQLGNRSQAAAEIHRRLQVDWPVLRESDYIVTGDFPAAGLTEIVQSTLIPTSNALHAEYFDRRPAEPILVLLLSSTEGYRHALKQFGLEHQSEYAGIYHRGERLIVVNWETGPGTLAHELTHALAHADFPALPEWFDEGLAALHEESEFSPDGQRLLGLQNWRRRFLIEALDRDCWKSLDRLLQDEFGSPDWAALDYASARDFCLYLQERGCLSAFYRACRRGESSPLLSLLHKETLAEVDADFRAWLLKSNAGPE